MDTHPLERAPHSAPATAPWRTAPTWALFAVLLFLNALARPYGNFVHDARLYAAQVLYQIDPNSFANDLFFRFGSQDSYSLFSKLVAPLVSLFGLEPVFFALYLICNALFYLAALRLVRALVKDPVAAAISLILIAVVALPWGGMLVFHVNENFLTPRILANALVLFALERLVRRRPLPAFACLVGALVLHPLMALPGLLVFLGWCGLSFLSWRSFLVLVAGVALAHLAVLAYFPLGVRLLGHMDSEWREMVRATNPYNFPLEWTVQDWLRVAVAFTVTFLFWRHGCGSPERRRLVGLVLFVAALGLGGTLLACQLPYALPMVGQPYRALWLLQLIHVPAAVVLARKLWHGTPLTRAAALLLAAYLLGVSPSELELLLTFMFFPILALFLRGFGRQPNDPQWCWRSLFVSMILGQLFWFGLKLAYLRSFWESFQTTVEPFERIRFITWLAGPFLVLALLGLGLPLLRRLQHGVRSAVVLGAAALAVQLTFFAVPEVLFRRELRVHARDLDFVAQHIHKPAPGQTPPTLYWPLGTINYVWFDLGANAFYDRVQVAGTLFGKKTAQEGIRRAELIKRFEIDRLRSAKVLFSDRLERELHELYAGQKDEPPPTLDDLLALCREPDLDYVIVPHKFEGYYSASNGSFYIYDCNQVRSISLSTNTQASNCQPPSDH